MKGELWNVQVTKDNRNAIYMLKICRDFEIELVAPVQIPPLFRIAGRLVTLRELMQMGLVSIEESTEDVEEWN